LSKYVPGSITKYFLLHLNSAKVAYLAIFKRLFYTGFLLDSVTNYEAILFRKRRKEERKDNGKRKDRK